MKSMSLRFESENYIQQIVLVHNFRGGKLILILAMKKPSFYAKVQYNNAGLSHGWREKMGRGDGLYANYSKRYIAHLISVRKRSKVRPITMQINFLSLKNGAKISLLKMVETKLVCTELANRSFSSIVRTRQQY